MVAEIGLQLLLAVIEPNLRLADPEGDGAAHQAVQHGHPDHEAGDMQIAAAQELRQAHIHGRTQAPEDADKAHEGDAGIEQPHGERHRVGGEEVEVFLDALVGVVRHAGTLARTFRVAPQFQPVKRLMRQPAPQHVPGEPAPPVQLQQLGQVELVDRNDDIGQRQPEKVPQLLPENVGLLVLQRVVEHAVPLIDLHQHEHGRQIERHDGGQQAPGLGFFLGNEVRPAQVKCLLEDMDAAVPGAAAADALLVMRPLLVRIRPPTYLCRLRPGLKLVRPNQKFPEKPGRKPACILRLFRREHQAKASHGVRQQDSPAGFRTTGLSK